MPDGRDAVCERWWHRAGSADECRTQRFAMWMRLAALRCAIGIGCGRQVRAEDVRCCGAPPGEEVVCRGSEHVFVRVRRRPDGTLNRVQDSLHGSQGTQNGWNRRTSTVRRWRTEHRESGPAQSSLMCDAEALRSGAATTSAGVPDGAARHMPGHPRADSG